MWESKSAFLPLRWGLAPNAVRIVVIAGLLEGTGSHLAKFGVVLTKAYSSPLFEKKK